LRHHRKCVPVYYNPGMAMGKRKRVRKPTMWVTATDLDAVYANRRRIRGDRGKQLLRKRGELLERPCAHLYETGGLRRMYVPGHENVLKRLLVHAGAFNLSLWMRTLFGIGTPRGLQGRLTMLGAVFSTLWSFMHDAIALISSQIHRQLISVNAFAACD
jgi:hypothetical protein